jgi:hypothetical protein
MRPTDDAGLPLRDYAGRVIEWDYHIGPAVLAGVPTGSTVLVVLDPGLLGHPAGTGLWHQRAGTPLQHPTTAQVTELGVAPVHPATGNAFPGSGYRPWADPPSSLAFDAEAVIVELMDADPSSNRLARPLPPL